MVFVPGFWLFIISEVLLAVLLLITIPYLKYPVGKAFFGIVASALIWVLMYTVELITTTLAVKILAMRIEYIGIISLPLLFFIMAVLNTGTKVLKPVWMILASMVLIFFITIWVIPHPNAFWRFIDPPLPKNGSFINVRTYGPMFYFFFVPYSHGLMVTAIILLVRGLSREHRYYWRQIILFSFAMMMPFAINFIYILGFSPVEHINFATASMGLSSMIIGYTLLRYKFLDLLPVTRDMVIETMKDGVLVFDTMGYLLDANSSAERILSRQNIIGNRMNAVFAPAIMDKLSSFLETSSDGSFIERNGKAYYDYQISPLINMSGRKGGFLVTIRDVSERESFHRKVLKQSRLDPLTEVLNRRALFEEMEKHLAKVRKGKGALSIMMIDIDDFKGVNDLYGHKAGDLAIDYLKQVLVKAAGRSHLVGRFGGDEFLLVCRDITEEATVEIARQILSEVSIPQAENQGIAFHVSIGISTTSWLKDTSFANTDMLITQADEMLYTAKRGGKNRIFSPSISG